MGIQVRLSDALDCPGEPHRYHVCGMALRCDVSLPALSPFAGAGPDPESLPLSRPGPLLASRAPRSLETSGFIGGCERRVAIRIGPDGTELDIGGAARYSLSPDGSVITLARLANRSVLEECTLGAPLILSLAVRDCWLLHAAAVTLRDCAVVIAGKSGSGKSTLAARLDSEPACRRVADDLVGLRPDAGALQVVPDYPQLKLPASAQSLSPPVRLACIYMLRPAAPGESFGTRRVEGARKPMMVAAHSVAARLFTPGLLRRHLAFCRRAAAVECIEITYPHTERGLEKAAALVTESAACEHP